MSRIAKADLVPTEANLLPAYGSFSELRQACDAAVRFSDGTREDVDAIVWCTGYRPGFEWIDLPLEYDGKVPVHRRGIVDELPGLYFVGLHFLYSLSSADRRGSAP